MARRKNVKRIDPRYFMDEKVDAPLNEAGGGAGALPRFSPLSSTKPGERIAPPGSQRPRDDQARLVAGAFEGINNAVGILEMSYERIAALTSTTDHNDNTFAPPAVQGLLDGIKQVKSFVKELKALTGPGGDVPYQPTAAEKAEFGAFGPGAF